MNISPRPTPLVSARPIPAWIPPHPIFIQEVQRRLALIPHSLHPYDECRRTKQAIRASSKVTLRAALRLRPTCPAQKLTTAMQLSRGLARADSQVVKRAIASLPQFAEAVSVDSTGICIHNHTKLDSITASIVREGAAAPRHLLDPHLPKPESNTADGRHQAHERWKKLWVPFGKRVALTAITTTSPPWGFQRRRQLFYDSRRRAR